MKIDWENVQPWLSIVGAVGGVLGAATLIRSYLMSRPNLTLTQKDDADYNYVERRTPTDGLLMTILVSNRSTYSNSILAYRVEAQLRGGGTRTLEVLQGTARIMEDEQVIVEHDVNVTPLNVPALTTAEAFLDFLIHAQDFSDPITTSVTATDMHGNEYTVQCTVPNRLV